jgi:hypothetical protein
MPPCEASMKLRHGPRFLTRILLALLFVVLLCLWLKELTERHARQAADRFLGPGLEQVEWRDDRLIWIRHDTDGGTHHFRWQISYEERVGFGEPLALEVSLSGRVCKTGNPLIDRWLTLSDRERTKDQLEMMEGWRRAHNPAIKTAE